MKIHIIFNITNQPTGGGNQFLKALKNYFEAKNIYTENPEKADIFLFNSYQYIPQVIKIKKKYPEKIFIHRIDGPIRLYSKMSDNRDALINMTNKYIADATVFQSEWSKDENLRLGLEKNKFETVINNAPDSTIFNSIGKYEFKFTGKVQLIATSWSNSVKKGFEVYKWLDENLDFDKYEMTFCGNSPIEFVNIKQIKPLPSYELAKQLKLHDIFITASQKDPCSNSLIEALHCRLPIIGLHDGGHPELIKEAGETFIKKEDIPYIIEKISNNYSAYIQNINNKKIDTIAEEYLRFFNSVSKKSDAESKRLNTFKIVSLKSLMLKLKINSEIKKYLS